MKKENRDFNNSVTLFVLNGYSMLPCLNPKKTETIIIKQNKHYDIGDVVAVKSGDNYIIHRLISVDKDNGYYVTKGDNNLFYDTIVLSCDILGKAEKYIKKNSSVICDVVHSKEIARRSQKEVLVFQKNKILGVIVHNINLFFALVVLFKKCLGGK